MGHTDITCSFFKELQSILNDTTSKTKTLLTSYNDSVKFYSNQMQDMLNKTEPYATQSLLSETHENSKKKAIAQV